MYRRMKLNAKTGVVIFAFSLLITGVFTGAMLWFGTSVQKPEAEKGGIYLLSPTDYTQVLKSGGTLQMDAEKLMGTTGYNTQLFHTLYKNLIPVSLVFLIALMTLSACLWSLLKRMQDNKTLKIAEQLHVAATDFIVSEEPVLAAAYEKLKDQFDGQLNDYKRLNAYLSHEQKNAVAILRTWLELAENAENGECLKKLDEITDSIDDIMTLSENAATSPMAVVDVSVICAEVYDAYRKATNNIAFDFEGREDTEILAKSRWIYRAVANLLDNAVKYGEGKPITLSVRTKNHSVIVSVKDHGIGIEEAKQERVFSDRYRVNELNKDGYGIGLSLVSHVCDLCGGFVTIDSEPGKGSTFYLCFPQILF